MNFSENLRNMRKQKDYSQEYLAAVMNVSRQTVSKWENGSAMPDLKKLTELAELFETSMDSLLGIENESEEATNADTGAHGFAPEAYTEYVESLFNTNKKEYKTLEKRHKTAVLLLCAAIILVSTLSLFRINAMQDEINNLNTRINSINSDTVVVKGNESPEISDYIECTLLKRNDKQPWLVTVLFTYSPDSYANNTVVKFNLKYKNGELVQFEGELKNGAFSAEKEIDLTLLDTCSISIDDGNSTTQSEFSVNLVWQYVAFNGAPSYSITSARNKGKYVYYFTNDFIDSDDEELKYVFFTDKFSGEIQKAELLVINNGEIVYSTDTQISDNQKGIYEGNKKAEAKSFSFETNQKYDSFELCLNLTDSKGVEYRRYLDLIGENSTQLNYGMEYTEIYFDGFGLAEKGVVSSDSL